MKRYTATFQVLDKQPDKKSILGALNSVISGARFNGSAQVDNRVFVELESREDKRELTDLFTKLDSHPGIQFEEIAWGWLVSDPVLRDTLAANKSIYPITPRYSQQSLEMQRYAYSFEMKLANIFVCTLFLICTTSFVVGLPDWIYPLAFLSADTVFMVRFCCPIYALAIFCSWSYRATIITCDRDGIKVHYSLRPSQKYGWGEIVGMELYWKLIRNEQWCSIHGVSRSFGFPINELCNRDILLMTLIKRARLMYVGGMLWENTVYKRSDAP